jgi:hypothetical protein
MIGDRDDVDLVPARELGIATILVAKDIPLLYRFPGVMKLIVET